MFPVLGNHEFQHCDETECLERWWRAFPRQRGRRWYEVSLDAAVRVIALDSDASLLAGSEQAQWLERRLAGLGRRLRFVLVLVHHPPLTDADREARPNERALAAQVTAAAAAQRAVHFVVCAAHVHNDERFERDRVLYLVSGGGGAQPTPLKRSAEAQYRDDAFPNFHYLRFELREGRLQGQMIRLIDADAPASQSWAEQDRFTVD